MLKFMLLAIACSGLSLAAHLVLIRMKKKGLATELRILKLRRYAWSALMVWLFTFLIYAYIFFAWFDKTGILDAEAGRGMAAASFLFGIFFYLILSFVYLAFYYLIDRSVSSTLLEIIDNSPSKKLKLKEIEMEYNVGRKYETELTGMLDGGFITQESRYYRNTMKGKVYARSIKSIKGLLKLGTGG